MTKSIIRKKVRGSNRISLIKIKRVRGETLVYLKICEPITELLKGVTSEPSDTLVNAKGKAVDIYNRTERWQEIINFFNEIGRKDDFRVYDDRNKPLVDLSNGTPYLSIYPLRMTGLANGVEIKIPQMITLAGLELWADKMNKSLSSFYRNFIEKVEIEAILRKPVI